MDNHEVKEIMIFSAVLTAIIVIVYKLSNII